MLDLTFPAHTSAAGALSYAGTVNVDADAPVAGVRPVDRLAFVERDRGDPSAALRDRFVLRGGLIYLDGNSLGALPRSTIDQVERVVREQWGRDLISSWHRNGWMEAPRRVGDKIGRLL